MSEAAQKPSGTVIYTARKAIERQIEIMRSDANAKVWLRGYPDQKGAGADKFFGSIPDAIPWIKEQEQQQRAVGLVIGEGGNKSDEITNIDWLYMDQDGDGLPLAETQFHVPPDIIVKRTDQKFHAYWKVCDCGLKDFREAQARLIKHYTADTSKHALAGVMRLAGTKHQKDLNNPVRLVLMDNTANANHDGLGYELKDLMAGLPELPPRDVKAESKAKGKPVPADLLREALSYADPSMKHNEGFRDLIAGIGCTNCTEACDIAHEFAEGKLDRQKRGTPANYQGPNPVDLILATMKPKKGGVGTGTVQKICNDAGWPGTFKPRTEYPQAVIDKLSEDAVVDQMHAIAIGRQDKRDGAAQVLEIIEEINRTHAVVLHGNRPYVAQFKEDGAIEFLPPDTFNYMYKNKYVPSYTWTDKDGQPQTVKRQPVSKVWPEHINRREYGSVQFAPGVDLGPKILNLYRGWPFEPKPGDWSLMQQHMKEVLCGNDDELFKYLMGWSARAVRNLDRPLEVAIILRGSEGCGKGTYGNALCRIFGQHGKAITKAEQIVGHFNATVADAELLFADEAFFAGDPKHVSSLKALITEKTISIEAKFKDPIQRRNSIRLVIASNDDFVAKLGVTDRRFAVFDVAPGRVGDREYFNALYDQLENGGYAAMLHDLLAYDLKDFDISKIPDTAARAQQKTMSLKGPAGWLHECLSLGRIVGQIWADEPLEMSRSEAYAAYCDWSKTHGEYRPVDVGQFGKTLKKALGDNLMPTRPRAGDARIQRYQLLGGLGACRAAFGAHIGTHNMEWDDE